MSYRLAVVVAVTVMLAAGCSSADESAGETAEPLTSEATTSTTEPTTSTTAPTTATTADEVERRPFKGNVFGQPSYLVPGLYRSTSLRTDITFDIPETENRVRWNGLYDLEHQMVMLLTTPEPVPGDDPTAVPGMGVVAPNESAGIEVVVDAILAATPSNGEPFFTAEPGQFLGMNATVVRGDLSQDMEFRSTGEWSIELPDGTSFVLLEQPERQYLMYVFELAERTLVVHMDAHPEQFDLVVTEGLRVAETLRAGQ